MPTTPEIEIVSASPTQVDEFAEGVVLRFSYKDGDGDLGEADPDAYTLWVKDSRLNAADGYHIPPLSPPDTEVPIQGELEVGKQRAGSDDLHLLHHRSRREQEQRAGHLIDHRGSRYHHHSVIHEAQHPGHRASGILRAPRAIAAGVQHDGHYGDDLQGDPAGQ